MTGALGPIVAAGNAGRDDDSNVIRCADGFAMSVVAGPGTYCRPRPAVDVFFPNIHDVPEDYPGPYTHVEVGFPSARPEPWTCHHHRTIYGEDPGTSFCDTQPDVPDEGTGWECYAEACSEPTGTVYAYVPVVMVAALIASHGGEA